MGDKSNNAESQIELHRKEFTLCINSIYENIGENAFYNVQSNDLATIRKRFYPPIYDAVMIATSKAKAMGLDLSTASEEKRINLLKDASFRKYISEGTMQTEHINGRINLALKYLYNYE